MESVTWETSMPTFGQELTVRHTNLVSTLRWSTRRRAISYDQAHSRSRFLTLSHTTIYGEAHGRPTPGARRYVLDRKWRP